MSPYSIEIELYSHTKTHEPDHSGFSDDEEIDIRILMRRIHRERIHDCDHLDSRNPCEFLDICFCTVKKESFPFIGNEFYSHKNIEFLLMNVCYMVNFILSSHFLFEFFDSFTDFLSEREIRTQCLDDFLDPSFIISHLDE